MIAINNFKIAAFEPVFSEVKGFSLLFDTPGVSLRQDKLVPVGENNPAIQLYEVLYKALSDIDIEMLTNAYLFCPLPLHSYHITCWDGVNDENVEKITPAHREYFKGYLERIPKSLELLEPFAGLISNSPLITNGNWNIRFKFDRLDIWTGSQALVARLVPADKHSAKELQKLKDARRELYTAFENLLGMKMFRKHTPHISLGYFANEESALQAKAQLQLWNCQFEGATNGSSILFESISLFGFSSMCSFFSKPMLSYLALSKTLEGFYKSTDQSMTALADVQRKLRHGVIYFMGSRVDHRFGLQSDHAGMLHSTLPTDYFKAIKPAFHGCHEEIIVCLEHEIKIEYCLPETQKVKEKVLKEGEYFIIKRGWPHRISLAPLLDILGNPESINEKDKRSLNASFIGMKIGVLGEKATNEDMTKWKEKHPLIDNWKKDRDYLFQNKNLCSELGIPLRN